MQRAFDAIYVYCTDFIIHLANITGLSYYEVNALLFCLVYPLLLLALMTIYIVQKIRLRKLIKEVGKIKRV